MDLGSPKLPIVSTKQFLIKWGWTFGGNGLPLNRAGGSPLLLWQTTLNLWTENLSEKSYKCTQMHTCKSSKEQILHCEPRWDFLRCFYLFKTLWVYHKQVLLLRNAFSPRIVKVYSSRWGCNRCWADLGNWVASPVSGNAGFSLFKEFERIWYFEWSNYIFIKSSRKFFHILLFFGGYDWIYLLLRYFLKRDNFYISDFISCSQVSPFYPESFSPTRKMKIPTFIEKNYWVEMTTCSIRGRILGLKELYFHFCLNLVGCVSIFGIQQQKCWNLFALAFMLSFCCALKITE